MKIAMTVLALLWSALAIAQDDLDEAFAIFHQSDYALTGGIYSRSPAHLDRARRELMVGNLYLNQGTAVGGLTILKFSEIRLKDAWFEIDDRHVFLTVR